MKKFELKPFDLEAFKGGAIALTDDKTLFARFVCNYSSSLVYPVLVVYFPVSYLFLEDKFITPCRVESVTIEGFHTSRLLHDAFHDEGDPKDLTYIVDGLSELDFPMIDVRFA